MSRRGRELKYGQMPVLHSLTYDSVERSPNPASLRGGTLVFCLLLQEFLLLSVVLMCPDVICVTVGSFDGCNFLYKAVTFRILGVLIKLCG